MRFLSKRTLDCFILEEGKREKGRGAVLTSRKTQNEQTNPKIRHGLGHGEFLRHGAGRRCEDAAGKGGGER